MKTIIIPKGTTLYRCAPTTDISPRRCSDTNKVGQYFSTYMLQALAMCVEYNKSMKLGVYELQEDVLVVVGKYAHLELSPIDVRYHGCSRFQVNLSCLWWCNKEYIYPSINHFDPNIGCILDWTYTWRSLCSKKKLSLLPHYGELFLSDPDDLKKVKRIREYKVPIEGLLEVIQLAEYQPFSEHYTSHIVLPL